MRTALVLALVLASSLARAQAGEALTVPLAEEPLPAVPAAPSEYALVPVEEPERPPERPPVGGSEESSAEAVRFGPTFGASWLGFGVGVGVTAGITALGGATCSFSCRDETNVAFFLSAFIALPLATGFFSWWGAGGPDGVERAFLAALVEALWVGFSGLVGLLVGAATDAPADSAMVIGIGFGAPLTPLVSTIFQINY